MAGKQASALHNNQTVASPNQEVLLAILTDLSIDHRCYKEACALRDAGLKPVILCDKPLGKLGSAWQGFTIRELVPFSHLKHFGPALLLFHLRLISIALTTRSRVWISLDCPPLLGLALLGRLRGARVIYDSHEIFLETPMVCSRPMRKLFWTVWHNLGLQLAHRLVVVSPLCRAWFALRFPKKPTYLLPNTPYLREDVSLALPPPAYGPLQLIFQGGLRVATGLSETFTAMHDIPEARLDIYGDGPERHALEKAAHRAGVAGRVKFHGSVPFEALEKPLSEAHIGIHLMQPICVSFSLTLANKLFDYAHVGLPVLLSDNPSHREFIEHHAVGEVVDSFDPIAIGAGIRRLQQEWEHYHIACLSARKDWNWQAFAKDYPAFLTQE